MTTSPTTLHRTALSSLCLLVFASLVAQPVHAQNDWPAWGRDGGNQRHSPLTQINADNVSGLVPAWRFEMTKAGVQSRPSQSTPLMVDDILYLSFPFYRVVALEPETGNVIWEYTAPGDWNSPEHQLHWNAGGSMRGLSYWEGDNVTAPQIVFGTEEGELISLNAQTGIPNGRFGNDGYVDLKTSDVMNGFPNMHYGISSGVAIYKHLVFTGVHNADETGSKGPAGDVRAWDLRTGDLVWTFHTVPHQGEFGNETWLNDSWQNVSGANTWTFFTIDDERGILYMPLGSAHNDFYGTDRPGDNLFANSIVAVDALTGERLWHFQAVHHDLWDLDMPVPPILFDVEQDGETIPAVGVMTKYPVLFIFNRVTGEPIYEIEERPVPQGNLPDEYYSPTQPFPVKPPPFGRISFTMDDIATVTPEHEAACRELLMEYGGGRNRGPFTPPSVEGALVFPSTGGGAEFTGGTFDPNLGYYIINYADTGHISQLTLVEDEPDRSSFAGPPESRRVYWHVLPAGRMQVDGWPCWQPPWSTLVAVNVNTGEIAWQIPFGTVEGAPPGVETGAPNSQKGGPTSTAGGIFFIGAASDRRFRAYETKTGQELWNVETEQLINGSNPITYMGKDGKQYVAVAAGTTLLTYTLP
jgi:quinoprotein glucose dehydrogenase